jgi:hypothetical protein
MTATEEQTLPAAPVTVRIRGLNPGRYVASSVGASLLCAGLLAMVLALLNDAQWWRGYAVGAVAGVVSAIISSLPLAMMFNKPVQTIMSGFLLAGAIRAVAVGAIVVLAVRVGGYPEVPTVIVAGIMYAVVVAAEGLLLWTMVDGGNILVTTDSPVRSLNAQ